MSDTGAGPAEPLTPGRVWPLLQSLVGVGILVALAAHLGTAPFVEGLRAVGIGPVLAALGIGVATTVFSAWRWCLVARSLGLRLSMGRAVAECYRALFLNSVLPAGVLGDVNRAVSHGRRTGDLRQSIRAVVVERMAGQVVLVVFAAAVLIARPNVLVAIYDLIPGRAAVLVAGIGVVVIAALVLLLVRRPGRTANPSRFDTRLGNWTAVAALSAAALLGYLTMFVIAARAAGSQSTVADLLPVLVLAMLAMGLPLSMGGWGPREAVTTAAFGAVGLGAAQGLTVAVVYGTLSFVACLPGAGVLLLGFTHREAGDGPAADRVATDGATGRRHDLGRVA